MLEPTHPAAGVVSLMTLAVALFGPQAGPYFVILLGSIGGGLWPLSSAVLASRMAGLWLMLRCTFTAVVLTSLIAGVLGPYFGIAATETYAVISFVIGALGDKWLDIFESIKVRLQVLISSGGKP
jgi:hypothetical protein